MVSWGPGLRPGSCVSREGYHPGSLLSVPHCGRVSSLHKWKSPESSRRGTHTHSLIPWGPAPPA